MPGTQGLTYGPTATYLTAVVAVAAVPADGDVSTAREPSVQSREASD